MISIRNRLIVIIFSTLFICIVGIALFTFQNVREEFTEVMDGSLKQLAVSISSNEPSLTGGNLIQTRRLEQEDEFIIQVWKSGKLAYTSHPLIEVGLQPDQGYGNVSYEHGSLRYYQYVEGAKVVQIFQSFDERQDLLQDMQRYFILPFLLACPAFVVLIYINIGRGLLPLTLLSKRLRERDGSNLTPIDIKDVPEEIVSLVQALNQLLRRLESSLFLQRRFTSDAAHELRTPLAAIRLNLDMLKRADSDGERRDVEKALYAATERSTNLVENLLLLARYETDTLAVGVEKVNLATVAKKVIKDLKTLSSDKQQAVTFENYSENATIDAQSGNIYVVVENLIQNAILYTPDFGQILISVSFANDNVILSVADNGIGIAPEERSRIFDRFYRCRGTKQMGSGLGLSIVKSIVEYYRGRIEVADGREGKGTSFVLTFPKSSP